MRLYFVRHGETVFNADGIHQHSRAELSDNGLKQARSVAKRFADIPIDTILSSTYIRTKQTVSEINKFVGKEITYVESLREIKRPSEIEGLNWTDPIAVKVIDLIKKNRNDPDWHYSDEDNFHDLQHRSQEFIQYLESVKGENILAVTHGTILRFIVCTMMLGDDYSPDYFETFRQFFSTTNTGITMCEKNEGENWKLLAWNDYNHLA
jgi:probable phosphoglycerate mutase